MSDPLDRLSEANLAYTEALMREMYAAEVDRRDKILSSMTVVSAPIAVLFAAIAFLANAASDPASDLTSATSDFVVELWIASSTLLLVFLSRTLFDYHRLLAAEQYSYLPEAKQILAKIAETQLYCETYASDPGNAQNLLVRRKLIDSYAEAASSNRRANDRRLIYRQGVFKNTVYALVWAGLGCVAVAWHRQQPHVFDLSTLWSHSDVPARATPGPLGNPDSRTAAPTLVPTPSRHQ